MTGTLAIAGACALFLLGMRLSAFFSGSETGFYRVSFLRLSIDAQAGDRVAESILWFARNPSYFVATTLVGNNVANYLTTLAIGFATVAIYGASTGWLEVMATLFISPLIFIFGELVPKNLYYRAPMQLLRKDAPWFVFFFRLFLVVSFPLIWITRLFERFGGSVQRQLELVLGRSRLVHVLSEGHREGLLRDVQRRLIEGVMHTSSQPVLEIMTPVDRILGLPQGTRREELLQHALRFGLSNVPIRGTENENDWHGYLRVIEVVVERKPLSAAVRPMPVITPTSSKLEALLTLRQAGSPFGIVVEAGAVLGIVSERGLVEQLFPSPQAAPS